MITTAIQKIENPATREPDLWQYGRPDLDEGPDIVMVFDGQPRVITPRMVRRPM